MSLALDMAESSKDQYYSLIAAFEESEPAQCKSLLHTAENHLLPSMTAASSSLRSLAASASSLDGVLLETKGRELGGIIDSFGSLRKMIADKARQAENVSPLTASSASAIAAAATQRVAAAGNALAVTLTLTPASSSLAGVPSSPQAVDVSSTASTITPSAAVVGQEHKEDIKLN